MRKSIKTIKNCSNHDSDINSLNDFLDFNIDGLRAVKIGCAIMLYDNNAPYMIIRANSHKIASIQRVQNLILKLINKGI